MPLPRRVLGRTGLSVSVLGFGCAGYWAKKMFPERDALSVLEKAVERGVNVFDTGPSYAAGNAEHRLGLMLRSTGRRAELCHMQQSGHTYHGERPFIQRLVAGRGRFQRPTQP